MKTTAKIPTDKSTATLVDINYVKTHPGIYRRVYSNGDLAGERIVTSQDSGGMTFSLYIEPCAQRLAIQPLAESWDTGVVFTPVKETIEATFSSEE